MVRPWEWLGGRWEAGEVLSPAGLTTQDGPHKDMADEVVGSQRFWPLTNTACSSANGLQEGPREKPSPTLHPMAPQKASLHIISCIKLMFHHG